MCIYIYIYICIYIINIFNGSNGLFPVLLQGKITEDLLSGYGFPLNQSIFFGSMFYDGYILVLKDDTLDIIWIHLILSFTLLSWVESVTEYLERPNTGGVSCGCELWGLDHLAVLQHWQAILSDLHFCACTSPRIGGKQIQDTSPIRDWTPATCRINPLNFRKRLQKWRSLSISIAKPKTKPEFHDF